MLGEALGRLCARLWGGDAVIAGLRRLSGGANMESWKFSYQDEEYVLRRAPDGFADIEAEDSALSLADQAALIDYAEKSGVMAPAVVAILVEADAMGDGFVMRCIEGETLPGRILRKPEFAKARPKLAHQCAAELARLHALPMAELPVTLSHIDTAEMVEQLAERYSHYRAVLPAYALALRWLSENCPPDVAAVLLHGDFRMGNLMVDADGLSGVLDWELAHLGDPTQDLAYLCMPSWRFGHYDRPVGGFAQIDDLLAAYSAAGGSEISRSRFDFWLVYSTLWWGLCCLQMTEIWRDGRDTSLERAIIGRRASEVEVDLLLLLEQLMHAPETSLDQISGQTIPTGQTSDNELAQAIRYWLESDALEGLSGHHRFERKVAINAMGMIERAARENPKARRARLDRATHWQQHIAAGGGIAQNADLWRDLRRDALASCVIDQPHYAGLKVAQQKWITV